MNNLNDIDKFFRDKLFHRDVEFDQKYWEAAQKLIDAQGKQGVHWFGGKILVVIISAVLILSGIGGYFLLNNSNENSQPAFESALNPEEKKLEKEKTQEPKNNLQNENPQEEIEKTQEPVAENKESEQKNKAISKENRAAKNKTVSKNSENLSEGAKEEKGQPQQPKNEHQTTKDSTGITTGNEPQNTNDYEEHEIFKLDKAVITINEDKKLVGKPLKSKKTKSKNDKFPNQKQSINGPNLEDLDEKSEEILPDENPNTETHDNAAISQTEELLSKSDNQEENSNKANNQSEITGLHRIPEQPITNEEQPQITTTAAEKQETKLPLKDRLNWLRHISLGISGGANISSGLKNTGISNAALSVRPIGGLRIAYQLNEQVDIETGLLYNYRAGVNSQIKTQQSTDNNGTGNQFLTKKTLSLHYLDLPLHFTYKYGKHSFVVGIQYSHLINAYEEIINTKEENGNISLETSSKQWSRNTGRFSFCDIAGTLGYEYEITERLKICARYNRGFFDITDDTSFGNSVRDKNKQFRIMVDYRFLKY